MGCQGTDHNTARQHSGGFPNGAGAAIQDITPALFEKYKDYLLGEYVYGPATNMGA